MSVSLRGQQQWEGFHVLCKAPEIAGLDRRVFGLLFIVFFVLWQIMGSFLLGAWRRLTRTGSRCCG